MKIKEVRDADTITKLVEPVQSLHAKLYPEDFKTYDFDSIKEFFVSIIDNPQFIFLVIEEEDQDVGYAWIEIKKYKGNAFKYPYTSIYVHQISINESQRGKGYGTKLMQKIEVIAKTYYAKKIELDYWFNNTNAKAFYKNKGFVVTREYVYKEV